MITLAQKYAALEALGYDCDTTAGEITEWRDVRPQPETWEEIIENANPAIIAASARKTWDSVAEFWAEFENGEKYAIETSLDPEVIILRADLKLWLKDVWSDDPRIVYALTKLVTAGILTDERKGRILKK